MRKRWVTGIAMFATAAILAAACSSNNTSSSGAAPSGSPQKGGTYRTATQTLSNSFLSDLVPGFNLQITHDLWDREVSSDSAKLDPFLQAVSASFGLSANTFRAIGSLFGLGKPRLSR